jgi:predicted nucleic acid-binding protein
MPSEISVFVDTNVVLYSIDDQELEKQAMARQWMSWCWTQRSGRISSQVLNEFYHKATTKFKAQLSVLESRRVVTRLRQWQPPHLDTYTVDGAWALQDRFHISYWDALIVSSAQQQGCNYLLSEDMQHDLQVDQLRIINPFKVSPEEISQ